VPTELPLVPAPLLVDPSGVWDWKNAYTTAGSSATS